MCSDDTTSSCNRLQVFSLEAFYAVTYIIQKLSFREVYVTPYLGIFGNNKKYTLMSRFV
jgi:hypothetical protein